MSAPVIPFTEPNWGEDRSNMLAMILQFVREFLIIFLMIKPGRFERREEG